MVPLGEDSTWVSPTINFSPPCFGDRARFAGSVPTSPEGLALGHWRVNSSLMLRGMAGKKSKSFASCGDLYGFMQIPRWSTWSATCKPCLYSRPAHIQYGNKDKGGQGQDKEDREPEGIAVVAEPGDKERHRWRDHESTQGPQSTHHAC